MRMKSEREILAEMRRLRHQLDKQRLLKTTAALKAAEQEIETLRAQLQQPATTPSPATNGG
jgi:hypothetical protein